MATTAGKVSRPRSRRWLWIVGSVAALAVAGFFLAPRFLGDRLPARGGASPSSTVETMTATLQPYVLMVTGSGTLTAIQSRELAPEVTGVVATVVDAGTRVKAGDVLVQLGTDTFERSVRDAQFALEQAQAQRGSTASTQASSDTTLQQSIANAQRTIANAERDVQTKLSDLNLKKQLNAVGSESSENVRLAQNAYDTSVATLEEARLNLQTQQESQIYQGSSNEQTLRNSDLAIEAARNNLEKAQEDLTKTTIVAPFDGVVSIVNVKTGSIVSTTTAMVTIIDDSQVELPAEIDETEISKVQLGQKATVTLDALSGETFEGEVTQIAAAARIVSNIPIFDVTILLDNGNGHLRDGMSAEADITISEVADTITVPSRAVTTVNAQSIVDLLQTDGSTQSVNVQVVATKGLDSIIQGEIPASSKIVTTAKVASTSNAGPFGGE
jgi:HlyD family secretion protein